MNNPHIARVFEDVADLLEILGGNPVRVGAYRAAARTIEALAEPAREIVTRDPLSLLRLPGLAKDFASKIAEIVTTGDLALRHELVAKLPRAKRTQMPASLAKAS
jgi:DNA polymerase (family 10)